MDCDVSDGRVYCKVAAGIAVDSGAVRTAVPSIVRAIYAESVGLALVWVVGGITVDDAYWIGAFEKP